MQKQMKIKYIGGDFFEGIVRILCNTGCEGDFWTETNSELLTYRNI